MKVIISCTLAICMSWSYISRFTWLNSTPLTPSRFIMSNITTCNQQPPELHVICSGLSCHPSPNSQLSCTWALQPNTKHALSFQASDDSLNKFRVLLRKPLNFPPLLLPLQHEPFSCFSSCVPLTCNHILPQLSHRHSSLPDCRKRKRHTGSGYWLQRPLKSWKSKGAFIRTAGLWRQM